MNHRHIRSLLSTVAALGLAALAYPAHLQYYSVTFESLNADMDKDGIVPHGYGQITLMLEGADQDLMSGTAAIRVQMHVAGLEDLTEIEGAAHVAHIHGQFLSNLRKDATAMVSGPFFSGEGGIPFGTRLPDMGDDANGYLSFFEGLPDYGPVLLNLSASQVPPAPEGTSPLLNALNFLSDNELAPSDVFPAGTEFELDVTYMFDLSDADARRAFKNLQPLDAREIVVHGLTVPKGISDAIDEVGMELGLPAALLGVDVGNDMAYRVTAPVAAGNIKATGTAEAALGDTDPWAWVEWYQGYIYIAVFPWIHHPQFGWQYVDPTSTPFDIWIYDPDIGWFHTTAMRYPLILLKDASEWTTQPES